MERTSIWIAEPTTDAQERHLVADMQEEIVAQYRTVIDEAGVGTQEALGACGRSGACAPRRGLLVRDVPEEYDLQDPVLWEVAKIVHEADVADEGFDAPEAAGLDVLIRGLSMVKDDPDPLAVTSPLYDGLYEYIKRATVLGREPS